MAERVAAVFASREAAERAAHALVRLGADHENVSMLARGEEGVTASSPTSRHGGEGFVESARQVGDGGAPLTTSDTGDASGGATAGAGIGAALGLTAAAVALMVPGFGPVLAAGPLAWALGGAAGTAAAGAIAGGVYGSLRDIGVPEEHARRYEEHIRSGNVLLTADVPNAAEQQVLETLAEHGAEDVSFTESPAM